jgi:diguanylate cyclase (GGDEF)-like protein/PAS domain S-box-containing protein
VTWNYTPYAGILFTTAVISAFVGFMALKRGNSSSVIKLALLMFAITEWSFASGLESGSVSIQYKIFWSKIEYLGAISAPTLFLIFALDFSRKTRWLTPVYLILLSIVPIASFIVTATNDWHHLIWTSITPNPIQPNDFIYGHGIGYYILIAYDYIILSIGFFTLIDVWIHSKQPYRRQVGILLLGGIFPFVGGIVYTFIPEFLPGLDLTPVTFSITGLVVSYGILRFRLFDLTPIARDVLIENMDEGILVIDEQNRVVDINPGAQKILCTTAKESLGQPITKVLAVWSGIDKRLQVPDKTETEVRTSTDPPRYIHLHISPLYARDQQLAGRLLVFRDVSRQHQAEAQLAQTIEELGILNHIGLAVTSGLDLEQVLKTLYKQCSQLVPIDIFYVALCDETNSRLNVPLFYERGHFQEGPSLDSNNLPGTIGSVIQSRKTRYINKTVKSDSLTTQQTLSILDKPNSSYIGIPLTLRERTIGLISIQNNRPDAYTEDHIRILERIAVQAAIAIENARLYVEVQRIAIIDELTGIYNYRGLQELGTREVDRAYRFNRPLSVLFFDVDDFRNINNIYNHSTGNTILREVSKNCRSILRTVDVFSRYGGDEFVALLPETDIASAEGVARRMVEKIAAEKICTPFGKLGVTISIGVTALSGERSHLSALIDRANSAEHQAKQGQKGIVVVAP